jgi:hypothetical protein
MVSTLKFLVSLDGVDGTIFKTYTNDSLTLCDTSSFDFPRFIILCINTALLFGKVMIRDQNYNAKANTKIERQKATFIYQFLVNEDYGEDL